jgi:hypothetical protein
VQDVEDMLIGHSHLMRFDDYKHMRGVGYHPRPGGVRAQRAVSRSPILSTTPRVGSR